MLIPYSWVWKLKHREFNLIKILFLVSLGPWWCTQAFSSCGELGLLFMAVCRLFIAVASLVTENRLWGAGFSSCSTCAQWLRLEGSRVRAQLLRSVGLTAPQHVESSWTRDWTHVPYIGRQILNHWDHQGSPIPTFFWSCFQIGRFCMLGRSTYIPDKCLVQFSPPCDCRLLECICQLFPWSLMVKCPTSQ